MRQIPAEIAHRPFTRSEARAAGVSDRQLDGRRFVRILPCVYRSRDHVMSEADWLLAARLALPVDAHLTGLTRIQQLGLDVGPRRPLRFVIARDHHVALDGIFLHRTVRLPPTDEVGVVPAGAFIAYCARARVVDAIKVGDWLLHHEHTSAVEIRDLALSSLWRDGAPEAVWMLDHLDARSRSVKESETGAVLAFAGLPDAEVNAAVDVQEDLEVIGDLVYRPWGLVVEFEGVQHQVDREQHGSDIDRYALMRAAQIAYVQVTKEKLARPRTLCGEVFRALVARGYEGRPPTFGTHWRQLFWSVSAAAGPRRGHRRAAVT